MATGTVTITETTYTSVKLVAFAWTSTAGGAASDVTANAFDGQVLMLATNPDNTSIPSDNYSVTITDSNGNDVLAGQGATRDQTNTEYVVSSLGAVAGSKLTLNVSAAGDAKKGVVYLYIR